MKTRKPTSRRSPQGSKPSAKPGRHKASAKGTHQDNRSSVGRGKASGVSSRKGRPSDQGDGESAYQKRGKRPSTTAKSNKRARPEKASPGGKPPRRGKEGQGAMPGRKRPTGHSDHRPALNAHERKNVRPAELTETMRIAKAMARSGLCSRREAERWIEARRVSVNGSVLETPATEVGPGDKILIDGHPLPAAEPSRIWRYHKPKGLLTTHRNDQKFSKDGVLEPDDRQTVFETLPAELGRVISVGRLDFNTEGLLLLTNDGALARYLELPKTGWLRRYRVRVNGAITQEQLNTLTEGITVEGVHYGPISATLDSVQGANAWLTVAIREGKNREVRRIMEHLGLTVNRLIRISFGPFQLLDLKPGHVEIVKPRALREQLSRKVADELGLIIDEPDDETVGQDDEKKDNRARKRKVPNPKRQGTSTNRSVSPPKKPLAKKSKTQNRGANNKGSKPTAKNTKPKSQKNPSGPRRGGRP
ncbi:MAG: pseudouridine synthase [Hyphomicrobiaceae bacterium]